jgi:hypothetical protein
MRHEDFYTALYTEQHDNPTDYEAEQAAIEAEIEAAWRERREQMAQ